MKPIRNKLKRCNVGAILRARAHGETFAKIAKRYHVTIQAIRYHCCRAGVKKGVRRASI